MVLFVSDLHFGRDPAGDRAAEADLVACLRAHAEVATHLYLVGDLYDAYVEYPHLVPGGLVRLKGLLAAWADRGVPITYLAGNHDLWHRNHFACEVGVEMAGTDCLAHHYGRWVYATHGDAVDSSSPFFARLRPLLHHPLALALFPYAFPGDGGAALARWVNDRFHREVLEPERRDALRAAAHRLLHETRTDLVVMGHSHWPDTLHAPHGTYLNLGAWYLQRTFAVLDADGPRLLHWNGAKASPIEKLSKAWMPDASSSPLPA